MMIFKRSIIFITILLFFNFHESFSAKYKLVRYIRLFKIEKCPGNDQLDMRFIRTEMINKGKGSIELDVELNVSQTIQHLYGNVNVDRCAEADVSQSCEHFIKLNDADMCQGLNYKLMESSFFNVYEPNLGCPVQPGTYKLKNNSADKALSIVNSFISPDPKYFWKVLFKLHNSDKKLVLCLKFLVKVDERKVKTS